MQTPTHPEVVGSVLSTKRFDWDKEHRTFVAELSDLRDLSLGQIWPDSADQGFTLESAKTGKRLVVGLTHTEYNDGDILWHIFKPIDHEYDFQIQIFND